MATHDYQPVIGMKRKRLTLDEWRDVAERMKALVQASQAMYRTMLSVTTVNEAETMRRAMRRVQSAWYKAESLAAKQIGDVEAGRLFHGEGWVWHG